MYNIEISHYRVLIKPKEPLSDDFFVSFYSNETRPKPVMIISDCIPEEHYSNFFIVKKLPNACGVMTTQQKLQGLSEEQVLEQELGMSVINSSLTLKDIGGATALKEYTRKLIQAESQGYRAKGIFLVGIPGTGKTFFPKCFAGELKRKLINLNLSVIMESTNSIQKLNEIFEFLHKRAIDYPDEKFVILIDEIEKMIGNANFMPKERQLLGRLLTILNDINTPVCEYAFNAIFFATANDLNSILKNNPEFLRRGRWDELFFVNIPTHEYAEEMFHIYIKKFQLDSILEIMKLDDILAEIEKKYQRDNNESSRFPYTPAEIENFCKRLDFLRKAQGDNLSVNDIVENVNMIIPLIKSADEGANKMWGQKELFVEV